ncbi:tRNA dihydrouridine synthase DusB [Anderseniella sp. Alg231-50]|uniref:tRNA dihydrouridine synthase DusB n=1 Tax=Anderseniella sp. Alg231-50 TaxID=1922226 RepID=UPI000D555EDC
MGIFIGAHEIRNRVFLAPMSGVTDEPFRVLAHKYGAGLVVSEMVASNALVEARPDIVRRATGAGRVFPFVLQLAGREPEWMARGAELAQKIGADIIDINMGCPAREVAGKLSGSALMRDLDHACSLIDATVRASSVPVTLKMRLGWDFDCLNAPELAARAEQLGVCMITVHGRTRNQFYKGKADWAAIRSVGQAITIPLIANGDGASIDDVNAMLDASGADGVMIGRGAYGRPWWPGVLANQLDPGCGIEEPAIDQQAAIVFEHYEQIIKHYGVPNGVRIARKHIGWALERWRDKGLYDQAEMSKWRARLLKLDNADEVKSGLDELRSQLRSAAQRMVAA